MRRKNYSKEYLKGTRRRHWSGKFHMDKFLQSRLGQPWSKVHAELSAHFDRRTYAGYLFWRNIERWSSDLSVDCWIGAETGTIYEDGGYGGRVVGFYVHPWTGMICYQGPQIKEERIVETVRYVLDDRRAIEKITGIWYLTEYTLEENHYRSYYCPWKKGYAVQTKRQLSHDELRKNNLTNNTPEEIEEIKVQEAVEKKRQDEMMAKMYARP